MLRGSKKSYRHLLAWLASLALICLPVKAELVIEITQGMDNPTPIAIVPFAGESASLIEKISPIIEADLQRSGLFRPIPRKDMLSFPSQDKNIHYRDWRILGAEYIVIGTIVGTPESYDFEFGLYDVLGQKKVFAKRMQGGPQRLRDMAHRASDAIYEALTGVPGAFDTKIIYVEDLKRGNKRYRLVMADADGARDRVLFSSSEPLLSPAWSNDMKRVAYVSFETSRAAIFVQNLITNRREQVTNFKGLNGAPSWSPNDENLALVLSKEGNPEIFVLNLASKKLRQVTKTSKMVINTEPVWTKDGRSLIFTSNRGGSPQIYQVGLASGRVERLTFEGDYNARARITPDGKSLVMVHREQGIFHIAWQNIASGDMRILTETWLDESPSIAPNGAMLLYATQHKQKGVLAAVSMDAGVKFRLPSKRGDVREPAWSPYIK